MLFLLLPSDGRATRLGRRRNCRRNIQLRRDPHRRHGLRRHRAVRLEAESHAEPRPHGGRRHEAHQLLRRAGLHAVAGADDDRLLRQAGLAARRDLPGLPHGPERQGAHRGRACSRSAATPRCASASGTWATSRSFCPRGTASIITSACPTPTTWAATRKPAKAGGKPDRPPLPLLRDDKVIEAPADQDKLVERYTEEAVKFITTNKDRPFFLYLPHTAVHVPLHPGQGVPGQIGQRPLRRLGRGSGLERRAAYSTRCAS